MMGDGTADTPNHGGKTVSERHLMRIGGWEVDSRRLTLSRGDERVRLEPRAMEVLVCLADAAPDVVTQDELMDKVWGDVVVGPNALTRIIAQLRKAFGDDAKEPNFIETISRTGYRLVASVESVQEKQRANKRYVAFGVAAVALIAVLTLLITERDMPDGTAIAVLPFSNLSGNDSIDYVGDGLSEEVTNYLAQLANLNVVSRTSAFVFKDSDADVSEIGAALAATHIVEGSVREQDGALRVTAQLVETDTGYHVWSQTYERPATDVFAIQDQIAKALASVVTEQLGAVATAATGVDRNLRGTRSAAAYDLYLRGRHLWHQRGRDPINQAIEHFHEAVIVDPDFARAWAALAAAYNTVAFYDRSADPATSATRAREAAERALDLNANLGEAHAVLGAMAQRRGDWLEADGRYQRALDTTPDRATALYWYAEMLTMVGRVSDALALIDEAATMNPLYPPVYIDQGFNRMDLGRYEAGLESFQRGRELGPNNIQLWLGQLVGLVQAEDWEGAYAWLDERPFQAGVEVDRAYIAARENPTEENVAHAADSMLAAFEARRTDPKLAIHVLAQLDRYDSAIHVARTLAANGYTDWRSLWGPGYSDFRQQPAFHALVSDLGLVEYWRDTEWGDFCRPVDTSYACR